MWLSLQQFLVQLLHGVQLLHTHGVFLLKFITILFIFLLLFCLLFAFCRYRFKTSLHFFALFVLLMSSQSKGKEIRLVPSLSHTHCWKATPAIFKRKGTTTTTTATLKWTKLKLKMCMCILFLAFFVVAVAFSFCCCFINVSVVWKATRCLRSPYSNLNLCLCVCVLCMLPVWLFGRWRKPERKRHVCFSFQFIITRYFYDHERSPMWCVCCALHRIDNMSEWIWTALSNYRRIWSKSFLAIFGRVLHTHTHSCVSNSSFSSHRRHSL